MSGDTPAELLDNLIADLNDWRGKRIQQIRRLMREADPEMVLEWKWMGSPVWSHDGVVALANPHSGKVKLTFAQGAKLPDPAKLFNAGFGGNQWRAVDMFEKDVVNEGALKDLVRAAVTFNQARLAERAGKTARRSPKATASKSRKA